MQAGPMLWAGLQSAHLWLILNTGAFAALLKQSCA
jgi:hypothetical protein